MNKGFKESDTDLKKLLKGMDKANDLGQVKRLMDGGDEGSLGERKCGE